MAKHKNKNKHKHKQKHQKSPAFRNAAPRQPRGNKESESPLQRLAYTAGGAAGTALAGAFLLHEGWKPKTVATALAAVGAGLAWKGEEESVRSIGAGTMSAAGAQLALMVIEDRDRKAAAAHTAPSPPPKGLASAARQADGNSLPPGALEAALARAQARLAISEGELA
ncbi:MAG TPA: hypothetical protein VGL61_09600 [Kofleriaceae bacterium]|jgi:hypothetical protein